MLRHAVPFLLFPSLIKRDDGDARAAQLDVLILGRSHAGNGPEVFLNLFAQGAGALSMDDPHRTHAQHKGIIDVMHHDIQGVRDPFAAHVEFRFEIQFALANGGIVPAVNRLCDFLRGAFEFVRGDALI